MMLFLDHYGSNCQSSEEAREGLEQMTMKLWNWTYWLHVTTKLRSFHDNGHLDCAPDSNQLLSAVVISATNK